MVLSIVFIVISLIVNVNSQACNSSVEYSSCSSNNNCGCLPYSTSESEGVCALLTQSCYTLLPCQSPYDTCAQAEYICVRHSRCSSSPLCYPLSMVDQDLCPETIVTDYSSALDVHDGRYTRPDSSNSGHYYEAIQIIVNRTGTYELTSTSGNNMDTHGFLYNDTFYPLSPLTNLIMRDDDGAGNGQFKLTAFLEAGVPYTLVVTTHQAGVTAPYSVFATGPGDVEFSPIDPASLTSTTSTTTTTQSPIIQSSYAGDITVNSGNYTRYGASSGSFYYHAIEVRVDTTGSYTFSTSSSISDTYGYLYQGNFYPSYPQYNIVADNDDASGRNFGFTVNLRSDITYILVFTTYSPNIVGNFNVATSGPGNVYMNSINI